MIVNRFWTACIYQTLATFTRSSVHLRGTVNDFLMLQLAYWDDKTLFIEQKFITLNDGFVRAVVLSRQNLIDVTAETLFKGIPGAEQKPECPEEITHWLQSIEISSAKLRKKD